LDGVIFLCPFIWSGVFGLLLFHSESDSGCASDFVHIPKKSAMETPAMIRQAFGSLNGKFQIDRD
jgi:hypothetical protein